MVLHTLKLANGLRTIAQLLESGLDLGKKNLEPESFEFEMVLNYCNFSMVPSMGLGHTFE